MERAKADNPWLRQGEWATLNLCLMWIYENVIPPQAYGTRNNPDLSAWLIESGRVVVRMADGRQVEAAPGSWVFLPAGQRDQEFSRDARILSVCWRARWPDGRNLLEQGLPLKLSDREFPKLKSTARRLLAFSKQHLENDPANQGIIRSSTRMSAAVFFRGEVILAEWMNVVLGLLKRHDVQPVAHVMPDERVLLALDMIETHIISHPFNTSSVARKVGLSVSQLNRLFADYIGHTPKFHFHQRRLSEAGHLLTAENISIKEISFRLGFATQQAFYNWFHKHTGCAPSECRQADRRSARSGF